MLKHFNSKFCCFTALAHTDECSNISLAEIDDLLLFPWWRHANGSGANVFIHWWTKLAICPSPVPSAFYCTLNTHYRIVSYCMRRSAFCEIQDGHRRPSWICWEDPCDHPFFKSILLSTSCLHSLLPPPRDPELLSRLRAPSKYQRISNRTKVIYLVCPSPLPVV